MDINIDHLRGVLAKNIENGINTDVSEIADPNSKRKIKLHFEESAFKNRKLQSLVGTTFDEAGVIIKSDVLGRYKPKEATIISLFSSAVAPHTFDSFFELINY